MSARTAYLFAIAAYVAGIVWLLVKIYDAAPKL